MQGFKPEDTRVVAVVAHSRAGKTSLIEAMLYKAGITTRLGKVDDGTSTCDFNPEEKERKVTIHAKSVHYSYHSKSVFLMDTPGYADFFGEIVSTLRVVDSAIVVVNGTSGIEVGTHRLWRKLNELEMPRMIFVNQLDKENADFDKVVESIRDVFGAHCVPFAKDNEKYKSMLMESVAETDDKLLEKYLETGALSEDEINSSVKKAILANKLVPILGGSSAREEGISELMEAIEKYLPSPKDRYEGSDPAAPYSAFVFKTVTDPFVGQVTFFRVYSGTINANVDLNNLTKGTKEKIAQLMLFTGKDQKSVPEAGPGDIVAVAKLKNTSVNDVFAPPHSSVKFEPIVFPKPSISFAVQPKGKGDEEKIGNGLHKLAEEDHTLEVHRDKETKELVVSGMGDLHLDILLDKLKRKFGVEVEKSAPKIAYKETITAQGSAQYRHKKQSGGAGQFGEVWLRVEPLPRGTGFEFVDEVVGGSIPQQFVASCEKGIRSSLDAGILAGYNIIDVRAIVYDGKTHPVDSKDIAFQIAARKAFREACKDAKPVLLEPVMHVDVCVPPEFMGDVTGDLNSKRGRMQGMEQIGDMQVIKAQVPISEMSRYSTDLKAITGGQGSFTMEFSHYEEVPARTAQDIIAKTAKGGHEEDE